MKSFLSLIVLCILTLGNVFTQNSNQKENNDTVKKQSVNNAEIKFQKIESAPLKAKSAEKKEKEVSKNEVNKHSTENNLNGTVQNDNTSKLNNENSEHDNKNVDEPKNNAYKERTYEKVEIHKEVNDQEVILTVPNKKRNFQPEKVDSYLERVKNNYSELSNITYSENDDEFKFFFNDMNITDKPGLLKDVLIHFQIKEYTITQ